MKPTDTRQEFIQLRAEGRSYAYISEKLHISKSTCTAWEKELSEEVARVKQEQMDSLYTAYGMRKAARIRKLGDTLSKIDEALEAADLSQVPPEKLLDFKLKYSDALQKEYSGESEASPFKDKIDAREIITAFGDLLNRVKNGDVTTEQANKESVILSNLLRAYDAAELQRKLEGLEAIMELRG